MLVPSVDKTSGAARDVETSAVQAARLARAQRQAARDAPRGAVPQGGHRGYPLVIYITNCK